MVWHTGGGDKKWGQRIGPNSRTVSLRLLCELDVRPGMGHRFPPDFSDTLLRALDFVLKGD